MSNMLGLTLVQIMMKFRDHLDRQYFNIPRWDYIGKGEWTVDKEPIEGEPDYVQVFIDNPPDNDFKRACVVEISDNEGIKPGDKNKMLVCIVGMRFNLNEISSEIEDFSNVNAQSEVDELFDFIQKEMPTPFMTELVTSGIFSIALDKSDLMSYGFSFQTYIKA